MPHFFPSHLSEKYTQISRAAAAAAAAEAAKAAAFHTQPVTNFQWRFRKGTLCYR